MVELGVCCLRVTPVWPACVAMHHDSSAKCLLCCMPCAWLNGPGWCTRVRGQCRLSAMPLGCSQHDMSTCLGLRAVLCCVAHSPGSSAVLWCAVPCCDAHSSRSRAVLCCVAHSPGSFAVLCHAVMLIHLDCVLCCAVLAMTLSLYAVLPCPELSCWAYIYRSC